MMEYFIVGGVIGWLLGRRGYSVLLPLVVTALAAVLIAATTIRRVGPFVIGEGGAVIFCSLLAAGVFSAWGVGRVVRIALGGGKKSPPIFQACPARAEPDWNMAAMTFLAVRFGWTFDWRGRLPSVVQPLPRHAARFQPDDVFSAAARMLSLNQAGIERC